MQLKTKSFIENMVTAAIVLVLLQTITEDIVVMAGGSWKLRLIFLYSGFAFDLFFTMEFLIRSWNAIIKRSFWRYLTRENGWVDFIASVPLLVFTSGPTFLALLDGTVFAGSGALLGLLKVVKAVRMARVLRLLRLLKIFRRIRFADSAMVQRHTVRIITTAASTLIFSVTLLSALFAVLEADGSEEAWLAHQSAAIRFLENNPQWLEAPGAAEDWAGSQPAVLLIKKNNHTLYARNDDAYAHRYYGPGDYTVRTTGPYRLWFDTRPAAVTQAQLNILIFFSTLMVVLAVMFTYSPHFAITVSDPVNVMVRGLKEKSYNFEVSIPSVYAGDDVFRLAAVYNDEFLPMKERHAAEEKGGAGSLDISIEDIKDILS